MKKIKIAYISTRYIISMIGISVLLFTPQKAAFTQIIEYEESPLQTESLDKNKWKQLKEDIDYSAELKPPQENKNTPKPSSPNPPSSPWDSTVLTYIAYAFVILVVLGVLGYIINSLITNYQRPKDKKIQPIASIEHLDLNQVEAAIVDTDIQALLHRAIQAENWRLSIRLYYLLLLKKLNEQAHITWKKDKTNRAYQLELNNTPFEIGFRSITAVFERVWYGKHITDAASFKAIQTQFDELIHSIESSPKNTTV